MSKLAWLPYICLLFSSLSDIPRVYSSETWLYYKFDMLFLVMGFISLVDEIQFMLILHKVYAQPIIQCQTVNKCYHHMATKRV